MKGNTISQFMNDIIAVGGPEKELVYGNRYFFLETVYRKDDDMLELYLDEYDNTNPKEKIYIKRHSFWGKSLSDCVEAFEKAPIFNGKTIYEVEKDITVLFG